MADSGATEDAPITFTVKSSTDAKYTFTLPLSTPVSELKQKLSSSEFADTPAERQRLIYSGRVLKDDETLDSYKIKDGHTIHLVKSAASNQQRSNTSGQSTSTATPAAAAPSQPAAGVPTNLAAGTGNNPLAGLTGARYAGFAQLPGAGLFGPDGGMGPPPDSDTMLNMLENPQFQSSINEALQNPQVIDMMIQQNPMLRDMGPGVRQMMQSPEFRRMLTDPNSIRSMMQMQRSMGMGGGGAGGEGAFPAPGVTNTTEGNQNTQQQDTPPNPFQMGQFGQLPQMGLGNPFASLFGGNPGANPFAPPAQPATTGTAGQTEGSESTQNTTGRSTTGEAQNPFAALLNPSIFGGAGQAGAGMGGNVNPFNPQQNPFLRDPALMTQMMQAMGGQGGEGGAGQAGAGMGGNVNPFLRDPALMGQMMQAMGGQGGEGGAGAMPSLFGGGGFGTPPPADNRPPEERYADQLRQLNDMGFFEFERNIEALRRTGGSVQGAVEYLLSYPS